MMSSKSKFFLAIQRGKAAAFHDAGGGCKSLKPIFNIIAYFPGTPVQPYISLIDCRLRAIASMQLLSSSTDPEIVGRPTNLLQIQWFFISCSHSLFPYVPCAPIFHMSCDVNIPRFSDPYVPFASLSPAIFHMYSKIVFIVSLLSISHRYFPSYPDPWAELIRKPKWTKTTWPMPRRCCSSGISPQKWRKGEIDWIRWMKSLQIGFDWIRFNRAIDRL